MSNSVLSAGTACYSLLMELHEAKKLGLKRYNTGRPCYQGHLADRRVGDRNCVTCQYIARERWRQLNPARNKELNYASKKRLNYGYNDKSRERMRAYYRKKAGIPEATRPTPVNCECCERPLESGKRTHLDHDHTTGAFRGWLCNGCNLGIGALGDTIEGLRRAIAYLERAA